MHFFNKNWNLRIMTVSQEVQSHYMAKIWVWGMYRHLLDAYDIFNICWKMMEIWKKNQILIIFQIFKNMFQQMLISW